MMINHLRHLRRGPFPPENQLACPDQEAVPLAGGRASERQAV